MAAMTAETVDPTTEEVYTAPMTEWSPVQEARRLYLVFQGIKIVMALLAWLIIASLGLSPVRGQWLLFGGTLTAVIAIVPWFEHVFGSAYLAVALGIDVLLTSLQGIPLLFRFNNLLPALDTQLVAMAMVEPFLVLLIPLVLAAWAYGRRGALLFSTWAALLHLATGLWALHLAWFRPEYMPGSGLRVMLIYAVPFTVSTLAGRERRHIAQLQAAYTRLQRHADTVEQLAVSRERNRLARDLHDTLAHSLAGLSVQLQALRTLVRADPAAEGVSLEAAVGEAVDRAAAAAQAGLQESRQAIAALRSDPVAALGLTGALRAELRALETRAGLTTAMTVMGNAADLTDEEEQGLFRIAQEALSNVERHAAASQVTVQLALATNSTELTVEDDGLGFDPAATNDAQYGLLGMRERAQMIGAQLAVDSRRGGGTTVHVTLPRPPQGAPA